ncbi:MAG TPA: TIGR01777 family protein [Planctomycetes bacterium]|nr:TIGR01777 family protein [Planctomycetaceae bacterium]HIN94955.1 TIGR01777 family protein [Planctomycetota bacterium]
MSTVITGATGFVGRRLVQQVDQPVILSRNAERARQRFANTKVQAYDWNPDTEPPPAEAFDGVKAVIHLAGESVGEGRWTRRKKERILESRVRGTRHLVDRLETLEQKPEVLVSASAVGYYGSQGDHILDETAEAGEDYLADVCQQWEAEAARARQFGIRVIPVRIGIVMGLGGGALKKMLTPFKLGLGGRLGNGKQWMPWIHLTDLVNVLCFTAQHPTLDRPINATAPHPVTNRDFTRSLGKALHRPAFFPVPGPMLRLALGEFGSVLLYSQRVIPKALTDLAFSFHFPDLDPALQDILAR